MAGQDGAFARNESVTGVVTGQWVWHYDRPVDQDGLRKFHAALTRGRLGRVAAAARLAAAGDRWTADARFAPIRVDADPIRPDAVEDWARARADDELRSYGGPAWRLSVAALTDGGSVVTLVVSHAVGDGYTQLNAILEAVNDTGPGWVYPADHGGLSRTLTADARDALRSYARACRACAVLVREVVVFGCRNDLGRGVGASFDESRVLETSRVNVTVPTTRWRAAAYGRGGTDTTLVVAVMAELADYIGRVRDDGRVSVMMPAAIRKPELERRANSLGWAMFDVDARQGFATDLRGLRAAMKPAYAEDSPVNRMSEQLWRIHAAIPRPVLRWGLGRFPAEIQPMTTECSVFGPVDPAAARIDGGPAASLWIALRKQGETPEQVARQGGVLRAVMLEINGQVSLSISGSHPAGDGDEFRDGLEKVLGNYGLR